VDDDLLVALRAVELNFCDENGEKENNRSDSEDRSPLTEGRFRKAPRKNVQNKQE